MGTAQKDTPIVFLRLPTNSNSTIVNIQGVDYKVAWWLWGPSSIKEQSANYPIPPSILKQLIIKETCK